MYLFEDSKKSPLSTYFRAAYTPEWCEENFDYVDGHDGFIPYINRDRSKLYTAYVDITFDNDETIDAYNALFQLAKKGIVLPIPVINAEYYYLKQCLAHDLVHDTDAVEVCLKFGQYKAIFPAKNFEKFCKWCTQHSLEKCASLAGGTRFITGDCPCEHPRDDIHASLRDKAREYALRFPLEPEAKGQSVVEAAGDVARWCKILNRELGLSPPLLAVRPEWYARWLTK